MAKVFLSAGHGGNDPGASAYGLVEKTINLNIMLACRNVLMAHNITVVCSRVTDENDPVSQEVREANASGADVAVSFHTNCLLYTSDADDEEVEMDQKVFIINHLKKESALQNSVRSIHKH